MQNLYTHRELTNVKGKAFAGIYNVETKLDDNGKKYLVPKYKQVQSFKQKNVEIFPEFNYKSKHVGT